MSMLLIPDWIIGGRRISRLWSSGNADDYHEMESVELSIPSVKTPPASNSIKTDEEGSGINRDLEQVQTL